MASTKIVESSGGFGMMINPLALIIAALFEEFGGDASTESEMVNVSTPPVYHCHCEPTILKAVATASLYRHLVSLWF
jgi:hypothetical protein